MDKQNIVVYIMESPSAKDLFDNRQECFTLQQVFKLAGINSSTKLVVNMSMLEDFFRYINKIISKKQHNPIIHFSAHGNTEGIMLTDEKVVYWKTIREFLEKYMVNTLPLLSFSTCEGLNAIKIGLTSNESVFGDLIGPTEKLGWTDSCLAFAVFYNLFINKKYSVEDAVKQMNTAVGFTNSVFQTYRGESVQKLFNKKHGSRS